MPGFVLIAVLMNALLCGIVMVLVDVIVYYQLENEFHATRTLTGVANLFSTLSGIPVFWFSKILIERFGIWRTLLGSQLLLVPRLMLNIFVDQHNYWFIVPLANLLHGAMFAGMHTAQVELVQQLCSKELCATSQSLLHSMYFVLGGSIGNVLWGGMYDSRGPRKLYAMGIIAMIGNVILVASFLQGLHKYFGWNGSFIDPSASCEIPAPNGRANPSALAYLEEGKYAPETQGSVLESLTNPTTVRYQSLRTSTTDV
eukprot:scaffold803_cov310-Pinguiococcus_pyrenoidosus.AAC.221